ncbi:glycosyltransferase [Brucella sp. 10RB9214]|uniref:glycosyltransferase family 2 protein n=1 Tax=unclassified Brucella TaxID=2632610 RepID=UPI00097285D9|nr:MULTISPECIES: glycosyltransferase family 2 protein [unclassified Brucella]APY13344.1 hypothetical protein BKD02_02605 [Brucella sp. 09RB8910]MRN46318.1 glycosyltransferase [Brucella sp. 10RB9212]MRN49623.1 glycosyltransferase [Brucella sp. 10RB9214]
MLKETSQKFTQKSLFPVFQVLSNYTTASSVAVITRTKNRPVLLARAIASVLSQVHTDWHMYIVNDGGPSNEVDALVAQYEYQFSGRVTVIHNPQSLGMEAASNEALKITTEDFIVIHDDDDSWHPDFLQNCVNFLCNPRNQHYVAVMTGCFVINEVIEGDIVRETSRARWDGYNKPFIDGASLLTENVRPPICLLIKSVAAKRIGMFNHSLPVLGDWDYNIRLFELGDIGVIDKELAYYHHRPKGSSAYGNSVVDGVDKHQMFNALYRNSLIRLDLQRGQLGLGGLHTILHSQNVLRHMIESQIGHNNWRHDETWRHVNARLDNIAEMMNQIQNQQQELLLVASWQRKMLRPIYWIWRKLYPVRYTIARIRGRIRE